MTTDHLLDEGAEPERPASPPTAQEPSAPPPPPQDGGKAHDKALKPGKGRRLGCDPQRIHNRPLQLRRAVIGPAAGEAKAAHSAHQLVLSTEHAPES